MIYINEWLPNPVGNDNAGEFIELYNSGAATVSLGGYSLSDGAKKEFHLLGYSIPAGGYLVFKKDQTKLALKNTDGGLWLYGPGGRIVDQANFIGAAPEGKSFSRVDYGNVQTGHFAFLYSTPGEENKAFDNTVATRKYPMGVSLSSQLTVPSLFLLILGISLLLLLFFLYVARANRNISDFFFGRNEKARP